MISIYNVKKSEMLTHPNGEVYYLCELRGLSTDIKPSIINNGNIENGSQFIEIDTGDIYLYDLNGKEWINIISDEEPQSDNSKKSEER